MLTLFTMKFHGGRLSNRHSLEAAHLFQSRLLESQQHSKFSVIVGNLMNRLSPGCPRHTFQTDTTTDNALNGLNNIMILVRQYFHYSSFHHSAFVHPHGQHSFEFSFATNARLVQCKKITVRFEDSTVGKLMYLCLLSLKP